MKAMLSTCSNGVYGYDPTSHEDVEKLKALGFTFRDHVGTYRDQTTYRVIKKVEFEIPVEINSLEDLLPLLDFSGSIIIEKPSCSGDSFSIRLYDDYDE